MYVPGTYTIGFLTKKFKENWPERDWWSQYDQSNKPKQGSINSVSIIILDLKYIILCSFKI